MEPEPDQLEPPAPRLNTPQDVEALEYMMQKFNNKDIQRKPKSCDGAAKKSVPDVPTQWNSGFCMFQRILILLEACDELCKSQTFKRLSLLNSQWDYLQQLCDLLKPLCDATEVILQSKFPIMQQVVPIYLLVIQ